MITVTGVLVNPLNQPLETTIRITALDSSESVLSAEAKVITGADGVYSFSLLEGTFRIELLTDDEYNIGEEVVVDIDTPTSIDLNTLIKNHAPVTI